MSESSFQSINENQAIFPESKNNIQNCSPIQTMENSKLVRGLGRWDLTAIAINTIIGTGIFLLPAKVMALIGSYSLFAFVACAVIIALIGFGGKED